MDMKNIFLRFSPRLKMIAGAVSVCLALITITAAFSAGFFRTGRVDAGAYEDCYTRRGWSTTHLSCRDGVAYCGLGGDSSTVSTKCASGYCDAGGEVCAAAPSSGSSDPGGATTGGGTTTSDQETPKTNATPVSTGSAQSNSTCAKAGQSCDPNINKECVWNTDQRKHCYCYGSADAQGNITGIWRMDTDLKDYCETCFTDTAACQCGYNKYGENSSTLLHSINMYTKGCDTVGSPLENYEFYCDNPGGPANEQACLNRMNGCLEGVGCTAVSQGCVDMNERIKEAIREHNNGNIDSYGNNAVREEYTYINGRAQISNQSEISRINTLINKIGGYGLSIQEIIKHTDSGFKYTLEEDIACASTNAKNCDDHGNGQEYTCVSASGENGASCFVWSWVKGSAEDCLQGCEYNNEGLNMGHCKEQVPENVSTSGQCYSSYPEPNHPSQYYNIGEYKCPGKYTDTVYEFARCEFIQAQSKVDWAKTPCPQGVACDRATGRCGGNVQQQCNDETLPCPIGSAGNSYCQQNCGSDYECGQPKTNASSYGQQYAPAYTPSGLTGTTAYNGVCRKKEAPTPEECQITISGDNCREVTNGQCGKDQCSGACINFNVNKTNGCQNVTCRVNNDYDSYVSVASQSGASQWSACLKPRTSSSKSSSSSSSDSKSSSSGNSGVQFRYTITCEDSLSRENVTESGSCDIKGTENPYCNEEEKKKEDEEQKKQDSTAPKVTINAPTSGQSIKEKTAELRVTTDIAAICKYMNTKDGSFSAPSFSGSGMSMAGSGGTSHTATLNNLTQGTATDCKYNHTIVVLCKNSKASASATTGAIGSAQTSFTIDLSQNAENAPKVASAMASDKFTVANPVLKVITDRPADCEYKKDSDFTFNAGTKFETTGSYNHNAQLNSLASGNYTYYVVCKDKETCAKNTPGFQVKFTVTLEGLAPNIVSTTPATQTVANPTISVTTDIPSTCQYKKDSTFTYGDPTAIQFTNDSDYTHTSSLTALADGQYTFYVACKGKESGTAKTMAQPIITTLNRGVNPTNAPVISNTTPNLQTTNSPTLSVITNIPATCQYKEDADFTYGSGTQFITDGGTGHSVTLNNVTDGQHTFYVVCRDPVTGVANSPGAQIVFTINTTSETCANLSSNDRQSDEDRDYEDSDDNDSNYLWRSVEAGTRYKFTKVDWYAGYQFSTEKDGQITQLCGYFQNGDSNHVILYNSNYKEIANVQIVGNGSWKCSSISPVQIKTDKRYYVIARVQDKPMWVEYRSGLLPRGNDNAVVESGIRQSGSEKFGENIKKYDYMVFGLVDVRIRFTGTNTQGPQVISTSPIGTVSQKDVRISAQTDQDATCKFSRDDVDYNSMKYTFGTTGAKIHEQKVCNLDEGQFTFYVRCRGTSGTNNASTLVQFEVNY